MLFIFVLVLLIVPVSAFAINTGFPLPEEYTKRVNDGIERYRKSDASIKVVDAKGKAVKDAVVEVRQYSHDFLFGCAFPSWDISKQQPNPEAWSKFERYFLSIFNYTTTENMLKWNSLESVKDHPEYGMPDALVKWCSQHNIKIKGHCLVWGLEPQGYPKWMEECSPQEISDRLHARIKEVMIRYKGKIDIWDVVNEPLHCHWFEKHMSPDYDVKAFEWAREVHPKATLLVNEYGCHWGEADKFVAYCKRLMDRGIRLDAIGEQAHDSPTLYSPQNMFQTLDKLAELGVDLHMTEITQPSNGSDIKSEFVQGKWDEETQGKYYRYYYTLAFSHPRVKAITMWAMWDGSTWLPGGGIIRKDFTPKPAYHELDALINKEWRTNLSGKTGTDGTFKFRGLHGNYEVTVKANGKTSTTKMHVADGGKNAIKIELP